MSAPEVDMERTISSILDRLARLYEEAEAAIDATTNPSQAFEYATVLADKTRGLHDEVATRFRKLRARQAVRIRDAEALSLQGLATRISVSKARADQLIRDASVKAGKE